MALQWKKPDFEPAMETDMNFVTRPDRKKIKLLAGRSVRQATGWPLFNEKFLCDVAILEKIQLVCESDSSPV